MVLHELCKIEENATPLKLTELPDPVPGAKEILVRVAACGVCRTDLQLVAGDLAARTLPIVPGHQAVGRVLSVGEGVTGWDVGERAGVAWLGGACGVCRFLSSSSSIGNPRNCCCAPHAEASTLR